jgi:hypothetical protein
VLLLRTDAAEPAQNTGAGIGISNVRFGVRLIENLITDAPEPAQ